MKLAQAGLGLAAGIEEKLDHAAVTPVGSNPEPGHNVLPAFMPMVHIGGAKLEEAIPNLAATSCGLLSLPVSSTIYGFVIIAA